jgi:hypothetical protein
MNCLGQRSFTTGGRMRFHWTKLSASPSEKRWLIHRRLRRALLTRPILGWLPPHPLTQRAGRCRITEKAAQNIVALFYKRNTADSWGEGRWIYGLAFRRRNPGPGASVATVRLILDFESGFRERENSEGISMIVKHAIPYVPPLRTREAGLYHGPVGPEHDSATRSLPMYPVPWCRAPGTGCQRPASCFLIAASSARADVVASSAVRNAMRIARNFVFTESKASTRSNS